tara:strand:- start:1164 stop:1412 length:249 start_codon:yes stop_codon:yes gene_type:complete
MYNVVDLVYSKGRSMSVKVRNGNIESALRVFKRKLKDSNKLFEYKDKEAYEKPSTKRKKKKAVARIRERKRQEKDTKKPLSF